MKSFYFQIPEHQKKKLEEIKRKTGKSLAQQIRDSIELYLNNKTEENQ